MKILCKKAARISQLISSGLLPLVFYRPNLSVIALTTIWEQAYLIWYMKNKYSGQGEIVDLGPWFGATTISLAIGLTKSRVAEKRKKIHAYDMFIWKSEMLWTSMEIKYKPYQSFFNEYMENIKPWENFIKVYPGDLNKANWKRTDAIEFLFNDVSKSWDLANSIIRIFYPSLIPGVSIIVEQDYAHCWTSWIHLIGYRFRHYFKAIYNIPGSPSVVFKYLMQIPDELLNTTYSISSFSMDEINSAFKYSLSLVIKEMQSNVLAAKVMCFYYLGDLDRAQYELKKVYDMGFNGRDLNKVERLLSG